MIVRIQLLGRGGQGIKSAAHIVGTAAFLDGYVVQDQPLYGAERRGAPITAFIRLSDKPILERGHAANPSLLVIADDSLLTDSAVDARSELFSDSTSVFINTSMGSDEIRLKYSTRASVSTKDLSKLTDGLAKPAMMGSAVAGVSAKLAGLSLDSLEHAMELELGSKGIDARALEENLALARKSYYAVSVIKSGPRTSLQQTQDTKPIQLSYHGIGASACTIVAPANSALRRVGNWSKLKPLIDYDKCTKCMICFVYCPDSAITIGQDSFPIVDYDACKGCDICHMECPVKAISIVNRDLK